MRLAKYHGLGNDFLVALDEVNGRGLSEVGPDLATRLCDRRRGLGADGLIRGEAPRGRAGADGVDVIMHLYNADGSRAEISGNGLRCLVHALGRARGEDAMTCLVRTDAGDRLGRIESVAAAEAWVETGMGDHRDGPTLPEAVASELDGASFATVDVGNPHLVILVEDIDEVDVIGRGQRYEQAVPGGVNVEFVQAEPDGASIALRVWERGVGVTEACGSGACAAAVVAVRNGLVPGPVVPVRMPGGAVDVTVADGGLLLAGPVEFVADVEVPDA